MDSIEQHIEKDKELLQDPTLSPQMRRHTADELEHLERYAKEHKKDIEAGDHHDPSAFEMYCDENPEADECRIYEDQDSLKSVTLGVLDPHFLCIIIGYSKRTMITFDFNTEYHWGALMVKLVPLFGFKTYTAANERELIWVFDVNQPDNGYHVPACNLSTYSY